MLFGLPVTIKEAAKVDNDDIINRYMTLTAAQKRKWLKAASADGGCIGLSQPDDPSAIKICIYDPSSQDYSADCWVDRDPFDLS
jgi:hypothetical protein